MTLMLHCGAERSTYPMLRELDTPAATPTHVPIPHHRLVDLVRHSLGFYGHEIVEEHHGLTADGARYFGLMTLESAWTGYRDTVVMRNSHDKKFPIGIGFGSRVFCCDNLAFFADHVVRRRHSRHAMRDIPGLVMNLIEPLVDQREAQHRTIELYRRTPLSDAAADHAILEMYRHGVINVQRIAGVLKQWEEPEHEDWGERTAWRLFNAATFALSGRVAEDPSVTRRLHDVIDGTCETIH
jgi:hypothetical protein